MSPHYSQKVQPVTGQQQISLWKDRINNEEKQTYKHRLRGKKKHMSRTVKDCVDRLRGVLLQIVKKKGGTEFSILRHCFLDWDADRSGELGELGFFAHLLILGVVVYRSKLDHLTLTKNNLAFDEFKNAMQKLGVRYTDEECREIVEFYDVDGDGEMRYEPLVKDVMKGAKHWMEHPSTPEVKKEMDKRRIPRLEMIEKLKAEAGGSASPSSRTETGRTSRYSSRSSSSYALSSRSNLSTGRMSTSSQAEITALREQLAAEKAMRTIAEQELTSLKSKLSPGKEGEARKEVGEEEEYDNFKKFAAMGNTDNYGSAQAYQKLKKIG